MARGLAGEDVGTRRLSQTPDCCPSPYLGERKKLWGMVCKSKNLGSLKALGSVPLENTNCLLVCTGAGYTDFDLACLLVGYLLTVFVSTVSTFYVLLCVVGCWRLEKQETVTPVAFL